MTRGTAMVCDSIADEGRVAHPLALVALPTGDFLMRSVELERCVSVVVKERGAPSGGRVASFTAGPLPDRAELARVRVSMAACAGRVEPLKLERHLPGLDFASAVAVRAAREGMSIGQREARGTVIVR